MVSGTKITDTLLKSREGREGQIRYYLKVKSQGITRGLEPVYLMK